MTRDDDDNDKATRRSRLRTDRRGAGGRANQSYCYRTYLNLFEMLVLVDVEEFRFVKT